MSQTAEVPNGTYTLTGYGFYRAGSYDNAASIYQTDQNQHNATFYANDVTTVLPGIFTEAGKLNVGVTTAGINGQFPNTMTDAGEFFCVGYYPMTLDDIKVTDNKLTIGVRKSILIATTGPSSTISDSSIWVMTPPTASRR